MPPNDEPSQAHTGDLAEHVHAGFTSFEEASQAVLALLRARMPLQLWAVTRTVEDDWIMLQADDAGYGIHDGDVFRWSDSFCSRMVLGEGPRVAPDVTAVPAYLDAPIGEAVEIRSYVGIPLRDCNGGLLGTLCAIDPDPQPALSEDELPLLDLLADLLAGYLSRDLELGESARRAERAEVEAQSDPLTGLLNRRGWDRVLEAEEARCRQQGHAACVVLLDVDGLKRINDERGHAAGDAVLRDLAECVRDTIRADDTAARLGGDEFAVLLVECDESCGTRLAARLRAALADKGVPASVGLAARDRSRGFRPSIAEADAAMYARKDDPAS